MQLARSGSSYKVVGFGMAPFQPDTIVEGIISEPEALAKVLGSLFAKPPQGKITARRVSASLPNSKVFTRVLSLPVMSHEDLQQAVKYEAEQYVPVPINDLYIDYQLAGEPSGGEEPHQDVLMVAAPRAIVDSYLKLFEMAGLEIGAIETSLDAVGRAMLASTATKQNTLVVDMGSQSADITVFNQVTRLTSTIPLGGDHLTQALVKTLGVTTEEAGEIKYKFGLGKSDLQSKVQKALEPSLQTLVREINKIIKYYAERSDNQESVATVLLSGGSASLPGLSEYLSTQLKLPVAIGDGWKSLSGKLSTGAPKLDKPSYSTAIGLAMREVS